jgi:ankyrin repeat protein
MDRGLDVNATDEDGGTPLHTAVVFDHCDLIVLLLDSGGYINAMSAQGSTPLMEAACRGNVSASRLLIAHGADVSVRNSDGGDAFLETAINGELITAKLLVNAGADIHGRDALGRNAADIAGCLREYCDKGSANFGVKKPSYSRFLDALRNPDDRKKYDDYIDWLAERGVTLGN